MPRLRALDMFSGIGGFALGMRGLVTTVGYCELDPDARCVLQTQMAAGRLDKAPIHADVRKLTKAQTGPVDIIMGGWPCQDVSPMGEHKGLDGSRSGLIREVLRLAEATGAKMLFLENVPTALSFGFADILKHLTHAMGYDVRWCVVPASAVGAHHTRSRLFVLASKPRFRATFRLHNETHDWRPAGAPQRMIASQPHRSKRIAMLGNAAVRDAVRAAFVTLASGFRILANERLPKSVRLQKLPEVPLQQATTQIPRWGNASKAGILTVTAPNLPTPSLDLVFDPSTFRGARQQALRPGQQASPRLTRPVHARGWATPRTVSGAGNVLTQRMLRDLPTQVRFEIGTPDAQRGGQISTAFVEWLMGQWTRLPLGHRTRETVGHRKSQTWSC
ncbi:hypothetical protein WJX72_001881 [[Myrmecia] bisecta]|uniref:DNA (cytosine-5-)-methyltransferase n=1 Tax=[Myrmecia] bisecta TaxID=41462 RepID=A0AAW1PVP6_9CHLO